LEVGGKEVGGQLFLRVKLKSSMLENKKNKQKQKNIKNIKKHKKNKKTK